MIGRIFNAVLNLVVLVLNVITTILLVPFVIVMTVIEMVKGNKEDK